MCASHYDFRSSSFKTHVTNGAFVRNTLIMRQNLFEANSGNVNGAMYGADEYEPSLVDHNFVNYRTEAATAAVIYATDYTLNENVTERALFDYSGARAFDTSKDRYGPCLPYTPSQDFFS